MKKSFLLRDKKILSLLFKKGKICESKFLICRYKENSLAEHPRFAIVVSKKIDKHAVVRNKKKRQIREALRLNISKLKKNYDIVLIAKKNIIESSYFGIEKDIKKLFSII